MLNDVSLKATYYDRNISFALVKGIFNSYVAITFPRKLYEDVDGSVVDHSSVEINDIHQMIAKND
jgi:hypothetical protein